MPSPNSHLIAWIDTETTGLEAHRDLLLEIAVIITDNALNEVGSTSVLIDPEGGADAAEALMGDFVLVMHTSNGLLAELRAGKGLSATNADRYVAEKITAIAGTAGPFLLAGNSITHDRNFLAAHAPQTFAALHYRSIDVSGIEQELARDGYADQIAAWRTTFTPSGDHRALGDLRDSIRQLAAMRAIRIGGSPDT